MSESDSSDEQAAGQHYLVCGTEDCQENGQFYCNACHRPLCEQCRDEHVKNPDTNFHEIVPYRHRKQQLPVEKCKLHPTRNVDIFCKECQIPLCSKCSTMDEHDGHKFHDLEDIYAEKYASQQGEFSKIQKYFLPTTQSLKTDIKKDAKQIRKIMESIRESMKAEAESLKTLVDDVTSEDIQNTYKMEKSLLDMLESQETTFDNYIAYLWRMSDEFQEHLSLTNQKLLFSETLTIKSLPETTKPVPPVYTHGHFNRNDITKLLGKVYVPKIEPEKRKIQPLDAESIHMKYSEKQIEQRTEKAEIKQRLYLSPSVTKIREYTVPGFGRTFHVSDDKSDRLWVRDGRGNLVQTDLQGNQIEKVQTSGSLEGYHTATQDGDLIFTDKNRKVIYRITLNNKISEFIKTEKWTPLGIHSSCINRDILVGMMKNGRAKVIRYSKAGKELQVIQKDNKEHELYCKPRFITENVNGDICTSDYEKRAVVVVNKLGNYKFSYRGQEFRFFPCGICTDHLGHILVCDRVRESVHLLDPDGRFLSIILSPKQGIMSPRGVYVDDENNLHVGQPGTNIVTVYKYLQ